MNRPLLLRILPSRLSMSAWSRLYRGKHESWKALYDSAPLRFAPNMSMELLPGDIISDSIAFTGVYELSQTRRMVELARRGGTLVDVGGNLGYFSLIWAGCNPRNKVIVFEASPRNIDFLRRNFRRNGLDDRVTIVPSAAGREAGTARFNISYESQTGWGGFTNKENDRTIGVDVVRIDEVVAADEPIALLKIDIEGGEAWALMGCERLLRRQQIREILYERNGPRMDDLGIPRSAAEEFLKTVGYSPTSEDDPSKEISDWCAVPTGVGSPVGA